MQYKLNIQGGFLTGLPLKVLSVRLHSESHQKISKRQNFLMVWHFWRVFFWADQKKKSPCIFFVYLLYFHVAISSYITTMEITLSR